jgi:hypothetical protein
MDTPVFLLWALEYTCTVRGFEDGTIPERVERQLRAARATSDAIREGRVFEGLCLDPPYGFRITECLELFGGLTAVQAACHGCPANAVARHDERSLAGCFGLVPLPPGIEHSVNGMSVGDAFPATNPPWYGLWMRSPIEPAAAEQIGEVLARLNTDSTSAHPFAELKAALQTSCEQRRPLHLVHYPPGQVEGRSWRLVPHCPQCKAPWGNAKSRVCTVCDYVGAPAPDKKRQARGRRPYFPLDRMLGPAAAQALLLRYAAYRGQQAPPDQAESPPRQAPPDNLPAG